MKIERSSAHFTSVVALIFLALSSNPRANAQSLTTNGESGVFLQPLAEDVPSPQNKFGGPKRIQGQAIQAASICQSPSLSSRVACTIALCLALAGIIADPTMCHAQSPSEWTPATSENAMKPDVHAAQDKTANPTHDNDPIEEKTTPSRANADDSWRPVPTKKASVANLAPYLLPYFNNGPVFGLAGTDSRDFRYRTQLSGDWGGLRTDLARHGFFFDLYSTSAYQDVASGGLKTGSSAFIQNTQLSMNVDTGRAGLWPGGVFHITLEARNRNSPSSWERSTCSPTPTKPFSATVTSTTSRT